MYLFERWNIIILIILLAVFVFAFSKRCQLSCGSAGRVYSPDSYKPIGCWSIKNFIRNTVKLNQESWSFDKCLQEAGNGGYKYVGIKAVDSTYTLFDCWVSNDLPLNKNPGFCVVTNGIYVGIPQYGIAVYEANPTTYMGQFLGCWNDEPQRALNYDKGYFATITDPVLKCSSYGMGYIGVQDYTVVNEETGMQKYQCSYGYNEGTVGTTTNPGEQGYKMYGPAECEQSITGEKVGGPWVNAVYRGGHIDSS